MTNISTSLVVFAALLAFSCESGAQTIVERGASKACRLDSSGKLVYSRDVRGNRLPDFSYVGYHSGEDALDRLVSKKQRENLGKYVWVSKRLENERKAKHYESEHSNQGRGER